MPETARAISLTPLTSRTPSSALLAPPPPPIASFLRRVGQFALELLALVEQRGDPRRHLVERHLEFGSGRLGGLHLFIGGFARHFAGERFQPPHAGGDA